MFVGFTELFYSLACVGRAEYNQIPIIVGIGLAAAWLICHVEAQPYKDYLIALGKHIQRLRVDRGLSQHQLAFEAGLSKNMVGNIERGELSTTVTTLFAMARVLDVRPMDMLNFEVNSTA